jgi:hypothetical protein
MHSCILVLLVLVQVFPQKKDIYAKINVIKSHDKSKKNKCSPEHAGVDDNEEDFLFILILL